MAITNSANSGVYFGVDEAFSFCFNGWATFRLGVKLCCAVIICTFLSLNVEGWTQAQVLIRA